MDGQELFHQRNISFTLQNALLLKKKTSCFQNVKPEIFFQFVKKAFSQRRKTLINCLKILSSLQQERLKFELDRLSYSMQVRAEEIPLTHFVELFRTVSLETSGTIQKSTIG